MDGKKYYETSNWYSTKDDGKTLSYPAPFDHDMYIILNLAVGGSWVGYPDEAAINDMENQSLDIDYVRVYQKTEYDENVTEPKEEEGVDFRDPDASGNYIVNGDFANAEELNDEEGWIFKTANEGEGSTSISNNAITIHTEKEGTVDYSIQLVQGNLPLVKGKKYKLSFRAKATANRKMQYAIQNTSTWNPYFGAEVIDLTDEYQTFGGEFNVYRPSDKNARLDN